MSLLSVSMDLPVLDISYKWNHTICDLLCLALVTEHNFFIWLCLVLVVACGIQFPALGAGSLRHQTTKEVPGVQMVKNPPAVQETWVQP